MPGRVKRFRPGDRVKVTAPGQPAWFGMIVAPARAGLFPIEDADGAIHRVPVEHVTYPL